MVSKKSARVGARDVLDFCEEWKLRKGGAKDLARVLELHLKLSCKTKSRRQFDTYKVRMALIEALVKIAVPLAHLHSCARGSSLRFGRWSYSRRSVVEASSGMKARREDLFYLRSEKAGRVKLSEVVNSSTS